MKKIVLFILALLTLFSLVACGEKAPEYKYDNIPELDLSQTFLNLFSARPIKGGALSIIEPHIYRGQDIVVEDWESEPISVLFDEENKFLLPLCYDYTCQHDGPDCFSYALAWAQGSYWNVVDDMIVVVNDVFAYQIVGDLDPNCIYAFYFSLDGTLVDKVSFDMTTLIKQDGSFAEEPSQGLYCTAYKNNVYLDVHDWADLSGEDKPKNRWVVCYDLEKKEFYSAAHYILPYASWEGNYVTFEECTETEIGIVYNNRYAYSINLEDGSWTETDCAEIYDNLIIKGIAHPGTTVSRILPLSNIIADFCYPICYYDTVTEERIELSENDAPYYYGCAKTKKNGNTVVYETSYPWIFYGNNADIKQGHSVLMNLAFYVADGTKSEGDSATTYLGYIAYGSSEDGKLKYPMLVLDAAQQPNQTNGNDDAELQGGTENGILIAVIIAAVIAAAAIAVIVVKMRKKQQ